MNVNVHLFFASGRSVVLPVDLVFDKVTSIRSVEKFGDATVCEEMATAEFVTAATRAILRIYLINFK